MPLGIKPPSHVLRLDRPLQPFFAPRAVAVIGATEKPGSVGLSLMKNLTGTPFGGTVVPVNPHHAEVLGLKAYSQIGAVPEPVDLAVIVTPAASVPSVVRQCVDAHVGAAIVISAGFKERGESGARLERQVLEEARRGPMRIIGPNCLGVMCPVTGLNATFAATWREARSRRIHQSKRCAVHGRAGLEPSRERRLQRVRVGRLDARRGLGRPHRLSRRRSADDEHRACIWNRLAMRAASCLRLARSR